MKQTILALILLATSRNFIPTVIAGTDTGGGIVTAGIDIGEGFGDLTVVDEIDIYDKEGRVDMDANLIWCRNSKAILERYLRLASELFNLKGQTLEATSKIVNGLIIAADSLPDQLPKESLTKKAILRGLKLAGALSYNKIDRSEEDRVTVYLTLLNYVQFIVEKVGQLDEQFYIPYHTCLNNCGSYDAEKFEQNYIEYARAQIMWPNQQMSIWLNYHSSATPPNMRIMGVNGEYYVKGSTLLYTKTLEVMIKAAKEDLAAPSIYANLFVCLQDQLTHLASDLKEFHLSPKIEDFNQIENEFIFRSIQLTNAIQNKICF